MEEMKKVKKAFSSEVLFGEMKCAKKASKKIKQNKNKSKQKKSAEQSSNKCTLKKFIFFPNNNSSKTKIKTKF